MKQSLQETSTSKQEHRAKLNVGRSVGALALTFFAGVGLIDTGTSLVHAIGSAFNSVDHFLEEHNGEVLSDSQLDAMPHIRVTRLGGETTKEAVDAANSQLAEPQNEPIEHAVIRNMEDEGFFDHRPVDMPIVPTNKH